MGVVLCILGGSVAAVMVTRWAVPDLGACPASGQIEAPLAFQLEPGLVTHQSWIEFAAPRGQAPRVRFALCADGRVVAEGLRGSVEDRYRISVQTRWVDWHWLRGDLRAYQDPARWRLAYTLCDVQGNRGLRCG